MSLLPETHLYGPVKLVLRASLINLWMGGVDSLTGYVGAGCDVIQLPNVRFAHKSSFLIQRHNFALYNGQIETLQSSLASPLFFATF